ncbi:hypothetical protein PUNSTDRAFT_146848 [Punctularia strigosozonata HHB-11173 SS5]|uniref:BTB domain-containing protein n=1 Tax=Punctularia strigosozonata (strain HHB-11173) TaxID=741275 RepID=R7S3S6_PUNST|nr:uncharacterized protein PUNSTDRAFT_146848 [Punctularia strigosozonata HHB-11173 SS5]EIN03881.1 hypothetical protein PUNSTDRAFT_146848 [Punctularia strigosozonata HHB-11173 SS5]
MAKSMTRPHAKAARRVKVSWPFNDPNADLVLRSSDGIEFYVFKNILSIASTPLKSRIEILPPVAEGIQTLEIRLCSTTLDQLLRLCYPVLSPRFSSVQQIEPVLKAAITYDVHAAIDVLVESLRLNPFPWDPLQVYACACRLSLAPEERIAATLLKSKTIEVIDTDVVDDIPAVDYIRLIKYVSIKDAVFDELPSLPLEDSCTESPVDIQPRTASPPFDEESGGDAILQSCDSIRFYVYKAILSLTSPFFRDMFTLPQSEDVNKETPVVCMAEHSTVLHDLLSLCYPPHTTKLAFTEDIGRLRDVLSVAQKFDMQTIISILQDHLSRHAQIDPGGVYAVGRSLGIQDLSEEAAKLSLRLIIEEVEGSPYWRYVLAAEYRRLRRYHFACGVAGQYVAMVQGVPSWYSLGSERWLGCCVYPAAYMSDRRMMLRDRPGDPAITSFEQFLRHAASQTDGLCRRCSSDLDKMQVFCNDFGTEIHRRIDEVPLSG